MKSIGILASVIFVEVFIKITKGYTLSILWAWFIFTKFGAPQLNITEAIGLCIVFDFLTHRNQPQKHEDIEDLILERFLVATFIPPIVLTIGYIVKLFM